VVTPYFAEATCSTKTFQRDTRVGVIAAFLGTIDAYLSIGRLSAIC
jgi:hypothetical protein